MAMPAIAFAEGLLAQRQQRAPQQQQAPLPWQPQQGQQQQVQRPQQQQGPQQQGQRPQQGGQPGQANPAQQQQAPVIRDGLTTERFDSWIMEVFRENGVVLWAQARLNVGQDQALFLKWENSNAPHILVVIPQQTLRGTRDFMTQTPGYEIEVLFQSPNPGPSQSQTQIQAQSQQSQSRIQYQILALSDFDFEGNNSISRRGGSNTITNDLTNLFLEASGSIVVEFRIRDQEGRVRLVSRLDCTSSGAKRAIERAIELTR